MNLTLYPSSFPRYVPTISVNRAINNYFYRQSRGLFYNVSLRGYDNVWRDMIIVFFFSSVSWIQIRYEKWRRFVSSSYLYRQTALPYTVHLANAFFRAHTTYANGRPFASKYTAFVWKKRDVCIHGQRRFSARGEIYYYGRRDTVDQSFNGILVSRSIACLRSGCSFSLPLSLFSSKYILFRLLVSPPSSLLFSPFQRWFTQWQNRHESAFRSIDGFPMWPASSIASE